MARVGITGHSNLSEPTRGVVSAALTQTLRPYADGDLVGLTCLAPGADQIFAEVVLDLGEKIEVIVPAADYADRIPDAESRARYDHFLTQASTVRTMPFAASGPEAYMAASVELVSRCDVPRLTLPK